jgi:hypothetical protein
MKIKFPEAERFIAVYNKQLAGKAITSFEIPYRIKELFFSEGELLARLELVELPDSPVLITMDIARVAELAGLEIDWKGYGFKEKKSR